jgi:O-antigen/teichoic acid export membrane protein
MVRLVLSEGTARGLSFVYYIVAARVLAPHGFGVLRYTTTLALLALGASQVLSTALNRELGAARNDRARYPALIGSASVVALAIFATAAVLLLAAHAGGLTGSADLAGLLVVLLGFAIFQLYYAIARGSGDFKRAAAVYAGGSFFQLVTFIGIVLVTRPGPTVALVVFGLSTLVPVLIYETIHPVLRTSGFRVDRRGLAAFWRIGSPLLVAQLGYAVWSSADSIWVENTLGTTNVGIYAAAKTLSSVFLVVTIGVTGVMLPRAAELVAAGRVPEATRLVRTAAAGVATLLAVMAAVTMAIRSPLLDLVFGDGYSAAAGALSALAISASLYGAFQTLCMGAVAFGRPRVYTAGMATSAAALSFLLVVGHGSSPAFAAWAVAASIGAGLACVMLLLVRRPLGRVHHEGSGSASV